MFSLLCPLCPRQGVCVLAATPNIALRSGRADELGERGRAVPLSARSKGRKHEPVSVPHSQFVANPTRVM